MGLRTLIKLFLAIASEMCFSEQIQYHGIEFTVDDQWAYEVSRGDLKLHNRKAEVSVTFSSLALPEGVSIDQLLEKDRKENHIKIGEFYLASPSQKYSSTGYIYETTWLGYAANKIWTICFKSNSREEGALQPIFGLLSHTQLKES